MMDLDSIFRYKVPNKEKLLEYGFVSAGTVYSKEIPILRGQFQMLVTVGSGGEVRFKVMETELHEEYVLVHVDTAQGGFVGEVRDACEKALMDISAQCFDTERFKAEQAKRIVLHIKAAYGADPEFLWEKYPNYAVFRRHDNEKWFAILMTVDRSRLGLPGYGEIEIMDLKDRPERIEARLDNKRYLNAYHMNKKHWFTVCLDGGIPDGELLPLIASSYERAK